MAAFLRGAVFPALSAQTANVWWLVGPALIAFTCANLYFLIQQLRPGNRPAIFWAAALQVYGYTMLALFVHENHLYAFFVYAAPLVALGNRTHGRFLWGLSALYGLNLYRFDGLGQGIPAFNLGVRNLAGFDLTLFVALANVATFLMLLRARHWRFDDVAQPRGEGAARS